MYPEQEDLLDVDLSDVLTCVNVTTATGRTYSKRKGDAGSQCCSKSKIDVTVNRSNVNMVVI